MASKENQNFYRIKESFARQQFMQFINAELKDVSNGKCIIRLPYSKNLSQQHGYFHAAVVAAIGDNACGYAAYSLMAETSSVLTVEYKINLVSPADGEFLEAEGEVLKKGRNLVICNAKIFSIKGEIKKLCALIQSTLMEMHDRADG